jgi:hypothetical protein
MEVFGTTATMAIGLQLAVDFYWQYVAWWMFTVQYGLLAYSSYTHLQ